jgi:hypothetical protein
VEVGRRAAVADAVAEGVAVCVGCCVGAESPVAVTTAVGLSAVSVATVVDVNTTGANEVEVNTGVPA